jgi:hypothetical protein
MGTFGHFCLGGRMEIPLASLSQKKLAQLQSSTVIPRMYLYIEKYDLDPALGAVVYEIEIGVQKGQIVRVFKVQRRYSALLGFDEQIRPLYKDSRFLQPFPGKKAFGNKEPAFLSDRAEKLQRYLTNLVRVASVVNTPAFIRTFNIDLDVLNDV